jgi:transcriptional regulator with XRE-family HTH domain
LTSDVNPCRVKRVQVATEQRGRTETLYAEIGTRVRRVRVGQKITQDVLAERVGLTRTSITNVEAGRQKVQVHTLVEIAEALGVGVGELLPAGKREQLDERDRALLRAPELAEMTPAEREWFMAAKRVPPGSGAGVGRASPPGRAS